MYCVFFFKQKTAYEMRISDWSSDVCSSDLFVITGTKAGSGNGFIQIDMDYPTVLDGHDALRPHIQAELSAKPPRLPTVNRPLKIGRASCRERVGENV